MPKFIKITDLGAPELEVYTKLTEAQLRNRLEPEKGIFIAESPKVIDIAIKTGCELVSILTEERCIDGCAADILKRCGSMDAAKAVTEGRHGCRQPSDGGDIPVYVAPTEVLSQITGYKLNRGVLCAVRRPKPKSAEEICRNAHRVAVFENIVDSTNIGAAFRSAAALGIDAVLITPSCCDPLLRRAVRVSMGTVLLVPWAVIGEGEDWSESGVSLLHSWGFKTAAMALCDRSISIADKRLSAEDKLAIVFGTEGDGLSPATIANCDYTVKIPMSHGVDSLNVAAAAAVAFWQLRTADS